MVKTISLSDEAYEELKKRKGDKSFSKTIIGIIKGSKKSLLNFAGKWEGKKEETDKIIKEIMEERHEAETRDLEVD
ncbi:MAG: antitoxin VapB family protein [archaeon]